MVNQLELVLRLLVAAALGSAIGFERERLSWAAGLRTHMLVCVGSCLLMIVSAFGFSDILGTPNKICVNVNRRRGVLNLVFDEVCKCSAATVDR